MDRVCINKITGRLIEMQQGGDDRPDLMEMRLETLKQNAINAGYAEEDIEVKWVTPEEYAALTAPTAEEIAARTKNQAINAIQAILDSKAREYGFDSIHTAAVWVTSKNPARKARAMSLLAWGDAVWDFAEAEWEKQEAGTSTYTSVAEFLAAVPAFQGVVG